MPNDMTRTSGPDADPAGPRTGELTGPPGYDLLDEVGRGGMGVVYRARDVALGRDVAVKVLADRYPPDSPAAQRFLSEARITGQLQHPGIPAVHQVGTLPDGRPFLAMKLIKGHTLEAVLKTRDDATTDRGRLVAAFEAVCQAVGYAHAHQVIHRDMKPANVMLGAFGEVQVMDWGLAKVLGAEGPTGPAEAPNEATRAWTQISPTPDLGSHTQAGSLLGTPAFVPPEQALGEIAKVDARSDVFGLGALLAVILTGKPPYVGETAESVRVQAVRGKLDDCFARLDASGAEPELVALCKRCLAFEPADRPRDAGEVATAVARLRSAAEERARTAERDKAAGEARAEEQRRKRRWQYAAAGLVVLALAGGVLGLGVYLRAQTRANADLAAKNAELAEEQAKVQARFDMAVKAIETFHTGVSEDALLKNAEFKELRTKLLEQAALFYDELEKLLAGQTDVKSRKTLATGYFQLAELTEKIGDLKEALAVHRKALAIRRELGAAEGADVETQLDVARSLPKVGRLLHYTGDTVGALQAFEEMRDIAERLEALDPTDGVRFVRARSLLRIGFAFGETGKPAEGLEALRKALAILQKLVDDNPANTDFQSELALNHNNMGNLLGMNDRPVEGLEALRKALAVLQKLVDANPANTDFRQKLGWGHGNLGIGLIETGKLTEALASHGRGLAIFQKLVADQPAVTDFQEDLAWVHNNMGGALLNMGKPAEGLEAYRKVLPIQQKLADANPAVTTSQSALSTLHNNIGLALGRQKRFAEAFTAFEAGLPIRLKLVEAEPQNTSYIEILGTSYAFRGGVRVRAGQPAEAATDLRRTLELWAKVPALLLQTKFFRARVLALLAGLGGDAKSGVTKDEAKAFAEQSVAALAAVVKTGWALPSELKEPDFDALRGRADFQKLVAEVEAKAEKPAAKDK